MEKEYQEVTWESLSKSLVALRKEYRNLLKFTSWKKGENEAFCWQIAEVVNKFLRTKQGLKSHIMTGTYTGRGTEFSGGKNGTGHFWVEFWGKAPLGLDNKEYTLIIDGAYAQFYPKYTPEPIKNKVRLMFFFDDPIAQDWYRGSIDNCGEHIRVRRNNEEELPTSTS